MLPVTSTVSKIRERQNKKNGRKETHSVAPLRSFATHCFSPILPIWHSCMRCARLHSDRTIGMSEAKPKLVCCCSRNKFSATCAARNAPSDNQQPLSREHDLLCKTLCIDRYQSPKAQSSHRDQLFKSQGQGQMQHSSGNCNASMKGKSSRSHAHESW